MPLAKLQSRGQVTLPRTIRRKLGCKPGDTLAFDEKADGTIELGVLPRFTLAEMLERFHIDTEIDWEHDRAIWEQEAAEEVLRNME